MVLGISSTKSSSSSSTEAAEAYNKKQSMKSKSPARTTVASLIGCCAGQEVGFPGDGIAEDYDNDNDSFVVPRAMEGVQSSISGGSAKKQQKPQKPPMKTPIKNDGFGSAVKKQQQRNRFTSSPLIERDSSLLKQQSGLLSLLSSGTFAETSPRRETDTNINFDGNGTDNISSNNGGNVTSNNMMNPVTMRRNQTPPTPSSMVTSQHTPPRSARRKHQLQQQQQQYSPNSSQQATTTAASPAMELSMARQSANATMSSPQYQRSRSMQHNHNVAPTTPVRNAVADTVAAMKIESPTKKARQEDDDDTQSNHTSTSSRGGLPSLPSILQPSLSIEESYSAAETLPPSTRRSQQSKPTVVQQTSSFSSTEVMATSSEHKKNIAIWKHHTKAALDSHQEGHLHHSPQSLLWDTSSSTTNANNGKGGTINEELNMSYKFPRMYLQDPTQLNALTLTWAWWYRLQSGVESTLGHVRSESVKQQFLLQQRGEEQHRGSDTSVGSSKSHKKTMSFGTSPKSSNRKTTDNSNGEFSPADQPTNVWSEPHASTMKVRGPTYAQDGVKIPSEESMFAVLGVDNFVREKSGGEEDCRSGTSSFRERWKSVCEDVGVESVPFLLVFNFIVPWGNFQTYLIRPDADNGPFSTHHADRPSEKAWKSFLEGDTEYRNTVLKFIPRIIAGPWMVKKMVGSTPAIIGQKLPVSYSGSIEENYLEVSLDVTQGPALGNTIANTVAGKADVVTVDLGFVLEGQDADGTLPEQMLGLVRLHHFNMKEAITHAKWKEELRLRSQS
mmetsp:Transcript_29608/g.45814  ORF Transcript_29608/g.45814 Transcript_29608/m.45814 type:complete len:784 (+) Transcript_29608:17-2368(+)